MTNSKKYTFITGVSSGIGKSLAEQLLKNEYNVIGTVRSSNDAIQLSADYPDSFHPLTMDITDIDQIKLTVNKAKLICGDIGLFALINNAGIAVGGPMKYVDIERFKEQFDVNLFGLVSLTQQLFPLLEVYKSKSKIINISSVSGLITTAFLGPYCGSKYALEAITDAMRMEFKLHDINVVSIQAGPIDTPIWDKSKNEANLYIDTEYGRYIDQLDHKLLKIRNSAMPVNKISKKIIKILINHNPKPRYLMVKNPFIFRFILNVLPSSWLDKFQSRLIKIKD